MGPEQALADLTEISTQLESAVLAGPDGSVVASTLTDAERASAVAENAIGAPRGRPRRAGESRQLTQVQAATREGCVFVVRDERHVLAGVTGPDPTTGLVFYDLKTTLRHARGGARAGPETEAEAQAHGQEEAAARGCVGRSPTWASEAARSARPRSFAAGRREPRERVDLYFDDGSVVSFASSTDVAARLMPLARRVLASARG